MTCKQFEAYMKVIEDKDPIDYGMCPPPLPAQEAMQILINHFLGDDWYVVLSMCNEQVNTEAVYCMLQQYSKRVIIWKRILNFFRIRNVS